MSLENGIVKQLRTAKKNKGLTFQQIADKTNGKLSKRTVERIFNGESPMTSERYDLLDPILGITYLLGGELSGPNDLPLSILTEVGKMDRNNQVLILQLCREINS